MKHFCHRCSLQFILLFTFVFLLSSLPILPVSAAGPEPEDQDTETICYTALGDSIPNGYCADGTSGLTGYPALITADLTAINQADTELIQFTKNGLTTARLNTSFLALDEAQDALKKSDVITLTIGANDLMNEFKKISREILNNQTVFHSADEALLALQEGISSNPLLLVDVAGAITSWDYDSFREQWILAVKTIYSLRKPDSQMVVTTIYNPVENAGLPDTLNTVVKKLISNMNEIIYEYAEEYDYQTADLLNTDIAEHTQSDGLHPSQQGQDLIRNLIETKLHMQILSISDAEDEALSEEARLAKERIDAEKKATELLEAHRKRKRIFFSFLCITGALLLILTVILFRKRKRTASGAR